MSWDHPVWHDCVQEFLEDMIAIMEGGDVTEVGGVGSKLPQVVLHHLHRGVHVELPAPQELHVEVGVIWEKRSSSSNLQSSKKITKLHCGVSTQLPSIVLFSF